MHPARSFLMQTTTDVFEDMRQNVRCDALKPSEKNLKMWSSDLPRLTWLFPHADENHVIWPKSSRTGPGNISTLYCYRDTRLHVVLDFGYHYIVNKCAPSMACLGDMDRIPGSICWKIEESFAQYVRKQCQQERAFLQRLMLFFRKLSYNICIVTVYFVMRALLKPKLLTRFEEKWLNVILLKPKLWTYI